MLKFESIGASVTEGAEAAFSKRPARLGEGQVEAQAEEESAVPAEEEGTEGQALTASADDDVALAHLGLGLEASKGVLNEYPPDSGAAAPRGQSRS